MHARTQVTGEPVGKPNSVYKKSVVVLEINMWRAYSTDFNLLGNG